MEKINYIYLGYDHDGKPKTNLPKDNITAIKVKFDDGTDHYIPIIPRFGESIEQVSEVWIYGQGWKKVGKRKKYTIPVFDGSVDNFQEYLDKWGVDVIAYSINGDDFFRSPDCCATKYYNDFNALRCYGPVEYNIFATLYRELIDEQRQVFNEKYLPVFMKHGYGERVTGNYLFSPDLNMGFSFAPVPMLTMSVMSDEEKLNKVYDNIRFWELYEQHEMYPEYKKRKEALDSYRNGRSLSSMRWDSEYNRLGDLCEEIDSVIYYAVHKQVRDEIENGCDRYPIQMRGRIVSVYGEKVAELYDKVLNYDGKMVA